MYRFGRLFQRVLSWLNRPTVGPWTKQQVTRLFKGTDFAAVTQVCHGRLPLPLRLLQEQPAQDGQGAPLLMVPFSRKSPCPAPFTSVTH